MSSARIWVLPDLDNEMVAIESLLRECGERVVYALDADGKRVGPANARKPVSLSCGDTFIAEDLYVYEVECNCSHLLGSLCDAEQIYHLDHHSPGDRGFGLPPADFLKASALGQVISELTFLSVPLRTWQVSHLPQSPAEVGTFACFDGQWVLRVLHTTISTVCSCGADYRSAVIVPQEIVITAAADHCLGAAYRGECPGVDPDTLLRWRVASRARFQGRSEAAILEDVERARAALEAAPYVTVGYVSTIDYDGREEPYTRMAPLLARDMRRDVPVPELAEAAVRDDISYIAGPLIGPDGRKKYTVSGTEDVVRAWMERWALLEGLTDIYGDPMRGFAGGYVYV